MSRTWKQFVMRQCAHSIYGAFALALMVSFCAPRIADATETVTQGPMCDGTYYAALAQVIGPGGPIAVTSFYNHTSSGSVCESVSTFGFSDTQDLQTGQYFTPDSSLLLDEIRNHVLQQPNPIQQPGVMNQHYTPTDGNGVRGSLDTGGGFALSTGTPGYDAVLATGLNTTTYVPFVVQSAGDNGWLSIYGPGGVLFSDPLSLFNVGDVYFAAITPQTSSADVEALLTYWVGSPTSGTSSVYFPAEITAAPETTPVPEPGTLWLFIGGLGALVLCRAPRVLLQTVARLPHTMPPFG